MYAPLLIILSEDFSVSACFLLANSLSDAIGILSTLKSNLERCPYSRGDPGMQPTAVQECSKGYGLSSTYRVR